MKLSVPGTSAKTESRGAKGAMSALIRQRRFPVLHISKMLASPNRLSPAGSTARRARRRHWRGWRRCRGQRVLVLLRLLGGQQRVELARNAIEAVEQRPLSPQGHARIYRGQGPPRHPVQRAYRRRRSNVFAHACKLGLEGIVSKRKDSAYRSGHSPDWLKMKNGAAPAVKREEEEEWGRGRGA